jgi:hypothetical protein
MLNRVALDRAETYADVVLLSSISGRTRAATERVCR